MQTVNVENINHGKPWSHHGYEKCMAWCPPNYTTGMQFYVKWINFLCIPYQVIRDAHLELFSHDIETHNESEKIFAQAILVYLYINRYLSKVEVEKIYKSTYYRLGSAVEGHEIIYQLLGCNLSQIVLVAELLELRRLDINHAISCILSKDQYIMAVLDGSIKVPTELTEPDDTLDKGTARDTFDFIAHLSSLC